ncbi:HD domain-containing protein [Deinococcus psychrotolerans]|uniref:HD domain-containing protein n=1 Tax=Deinococcus psychrotolerans TaxID=2489213 RepID=A0A3G8YK81_9DEIO|nr:HD domain-containing protein [Deinococcus psychrotolerans]AZI41901.1 HD domain-containing protein [Deinococcus psychrotolerans]
MSTSAPLLTTKFQEALVLAAQWHAAQTRKGSGVPYLSHLLGVASLALEFGANETEAIAALLHDALEDGPHNTGRSHQDLRAEIVRRFGEEVARLVDAATDATPDPHGLKPDWATRKRAYLVHLPQVSVSALLVSASDKLHNSRSILVDTFTDGEGVFERFTAGKNGTVQYYRLLSDAYRMAAQRPEVAARPRLLTLFAELERTVSALETALGFEKEAVRVFTPLG